jgi:hypothetical protein
MVLSCSLDEEAHRHVGAALAGDEASAAPIASRVAHLELRGQAGLQRPAARHVGG